MRFSYVNTTVYLCTVNAYSYNTITRVATRGYTYIFFLIPYPTKYSTYEFITHKGQRASIFRFGGNTEDLSRAAYELDNIHLAKNFTPAPGFNIYYCHSALQLVY